MTPYTMSGNVCQFLCEFFKRALGVSPHLFLLEPEY